VPSRAGDRQPALQRRAAERLAAKGNARARAVLASAKGASNGKNCKATLPWNSSQGMGADCRQEQAGFAGWQRRHRKATVSLAQAITFAAQNKTQAKAQGGLRLCDWVTQRLPKYLTSS
jgi:hypothetical protein